MILLAYIDLSLILSVWLSKYGMLPVMKHGHQSSEVPFLFNTSTHRQIVNIGKLRLCIFEWYVYHRVAVNSSRVIQQRRMSVILDTICISKVQIERFYSNYILPDDKLDSEFFPTAACIHWPLQCTITQTLALMKSHSPLKQSTTFAQL